MSERRFLAVVNPRGGTRQGLAVLDTVRPRFRAAGIRLDVAVTHHPGHASELAAGADLAPDGALCVVGGDGTLHEVVNGLMRRADPAGVPLAIIPAGSGNSVARHLGCSDPDAAAARLLQGRPRPLDLARVNHGGGSVYCVNIVGWGAAVDVNRVAERLRRLGPGRYALAALWQVLRRPRRQARISLDAQEVSGLFTLALVCNTQYTGRGMKLAPQAALDDGLLDVILVHQATRRQLLALFRRMYDGTHLALPYVAYRRVRHFALAAAAPDGLNLDGELAGRVPVAVDVVPGALRLLA